MYAGSLSHCHGLPGHLQGNCCYKLKLQKNPTMTIQYVCREKTGLLIFEDEVRSKIFLRLSNAFKFTDERGSHTMNVLSWSRSWGWLDCGSIATKMLRKQDMMQGK